jgi:hypothetical protein
VAEGDECIYLGMLLFSVFWVVNSTARRTRRRLRLSSPAGARVEGAGQGRDGFRAGR